MKKDFPTYKEKQRAEENMKLLVKFHKEGKLKLYEKGQMPNFTTILTIRIQDYKLRLNHLAKTRMGMSFPTPYPCSFCVEKVVMSGYTREEFETALLNGKTIFIKCSKCMEWERKHKWPKSKKILIVREPIKELTNATEENIDFSKMWTCSIFGKARANILKRENIILGFMILIVSLFVVSR